MPRMICWFSCGATSAVAANLSILEFGLSHEVLIVCCDTRSSEHSDNYRFSQECEKWFGQPIIFLRNGEYANVDEVFERTKYMSGQYGARCTTEVKKVPRLKFQLPDDIHVWGFSAGERKRIKDFEMRNPELICNWILRDKRMTKAMCKQVLIEAGIALPKMYEIFDEADRLKYKQNGFDNNNCPACVKGSSPWYWDMIRKYFPVEFKRRCEQSRAIGCRLVEIRHHKRIFLDELPPGPFKHYKKKEKLSCGPECGVSMP